MNDKLNILAIIVVLAIIVFVNVYLSFSQASSFEQEEQRLFCTRKGYVSDEVWYVDAARNILAKIFGLTPHQEGDELKATLVYASKEELEKAKSLANSFGITILCDHFDKLNAAYVSAKTSESITLFAKATNATAVVFGWILGDAQNIYEYLNLEHPPSAKYIIALAMLILGDRPLYWRIPSIIMGATIVILVFLLTRRLSQSNELGLIAAAATAVDPLLRNMASIAMLDIYVTAFSLLSIYLAANERYREAILLLGFAATFKFTALTAFLPILCLYVGKAWKETKTSTYRSVLDRAIEMMLLMLLSFAFFQLLVAYPIILRIGIATWLQQSIFGAISWHLSAKCVGPNCPISSAPWDWFFGLNSFPLYIYANGTVVYAQGFVPAYAVALILMIISVAKRFYEDSDKSLSKKAWIIICGTFISYILLWIAGSRTQYSFYAVQLTPLIYAYLTLQLAEFLNRENLAQTFLAWKPLFSRQVWKKVLEYLLKLVS